MPNLIFCVCRHTGYIGRLYIPLIDGKQVILWHLRTAEECHLNADASTQVSRILQQILRVIKSFTSELTDLTHVFHQEALF